MFIRGLQCAHPRCHVAVYLVSWSLWVTSVDGLAAWTWRLLLAWGWASSTVHASPLTRPRLWRTVLSGSSHGWDSRPFDSAPTLPHSYSPVPFLPSSAHSLSLPFLLPAVLLTWPPLSPPPSSSLLASLLLSCGLFSFLDPTPPPPLAGPTSPSRPWSLSLAFRPRHSHGPPGSSMTGS